MKFGLKVLQLADAFLREMIREERTDDATVDFLRGLIDKHGAWVLTRVKAIQKEYGPEKQQYFDTLVAAIELYQEV